MSVEVQNKNCEKQEASTYDTNQAENFDDNACHNLFLNHYPSYAFQIWFNRFSIGSFGMMAVKENK